MSHEESAIPLPWVSRLAKLNGKGRGKVVRLQHRQFLPPDHPDREDKKNFTKGKVVHEVNEIPTFSGADVLA